jgi:uncharacterized protein
MEKSHSILKFYLSTTDKINTKLLYEYIVQEARKQGISGVTVYRGIMGYGLSSTIYSSKFWELTEKLPVMIEIIDQTDKLEAFYQHLEPELSELPKGCLITLEPVIIKLHKSGKG